MYILSKASYSGTTLFSVRFSNFVNPVVKGEASILITVQILCIWDR